MRKDGFESDKFYIVVRVHEKDRAGVIINTLYTPIPRCPMCGEKLNQE